MKNVANVSAFLTPIIQAKTFNFANFQKENSFSSDFVFLIQSISLINLNFLLSYVAISWSAWASFYGDGGQINLDRLEASGVTYQYTHRNT